MKVWPLRLPLCDISLRQKIKEGMEERRVNGVWGLPPPSVQPRHYWSLTEDGERDPGSFKSQPQITAMERCRGTVGEEHLLCEMVGKCGSHPWRESHRVRSNDHSGFVLSVRKLSLTWSLRGTPLFLCRRIPSISQPFSWNMSSWVCWLHACLTWLGHFSEPLLPLRPPRFRGLWYLPATLVVRSTLRHQE